LVASPTERHEFPVVVKGERLGSVLITGEPRDEIAEAWEHTAALGTVALALNVSVIGILYVLFGRVLDPLTGVARGLADLERRNYRVRLPRPRPQELAAITDRFNALAQALDAVRAENEQLNHRLITAQDDERRRTAMELHDEVGPSLFGLKANASSIATAAADLPQPIAAKMTARVRDIQAIVEHLQGINRSMLKRLRPMALGHVPLQQILSELVAERARQLPQIDFAFSADKLEPGYGDSVDLTIYRCVQESLTNVHRHSRSRKAEVSLAASNGQVVLQVRDYGKGLPPDVLDRFRRKRAHGGVGLAGMRERIHELGGRLDMHSDSRGTQVVATLPRRERRGSAEEFAAD
jgi:two-component system sensor histidine kinase UhpB